MYLWHEWQNFSKLITKTIMDNSNNRIMKSCSKVPSGIKERKSDDQEYSFLLGYVTKLLLNTPFFKGIFTELRQQRCISSHTFRQFPLKVGLENSLINCSTNCSLFTPLTVVCLPVRSVPPPPIHLPQSPTPWRMH